MTVLYYKSSKTIMTTACYKSGKSIMTNLIIIKIKFIYFPKDEVCGSYVKLYAKLHTRSNTRSNTRSYIRSHDYKSCD